MIFIALLILSTLAIAGSAAFFSVYGLATTFSGTFISVIVMGASLEAGKLIAASYLYRYWERTRWIHKAYLIAGVIALMIMTSTGIFGYLSSGYQTDVLPLKQTKEQITLLQGEKDRLVARKKQIDEQIAQLPPNYVTSRIRLSKQFKGEQEEATNRINSIDKQLLELKTKQIKTETHIGPITYIAKAFGVETDDATKWLIFLIIFAFDPMAIALTIAVNVAIRERELKKAAEKKPVQLPPVPEIGLASTGPQAQPYVLHSGTPHLYDDVSATATPPSYHPLHRTLIDDLPPPPPTVEEQPEPEFVVPAPTPEPETEQAEEPVEEPTNGSVNVEQQEPRPVKIPSAEKGQSRRHRPFSRLWEGGGSRKLQELLNQREYLMRKQERGEDLSKDDLWELNAIDDVLKKYGYDEYLT